MSNSRHQTSQVRGYSITHPPGRVSVPTQPGWDYLLFASAGLFTAVTESEAWTVPAHRALCVPDGTRVKIETAKRAAIRCLYIVEDLECLGPELRVVNLTPLTRELMSYAVATAPMTLDEPANQALITLLAERLGTEADAPLLLTLPADPVAKQVAASIMSDPAVPLEERLRETNASRRTIERCFKSETLMSLGQWRRRARVLAAVAMLSQGESVTRVATAVGYATPSSFVAAFRSELGAPPREFTQS